MQFVDARNGLTLKCYYDISLPQTSPACRAAWFNAGHQHTMIHCEPMKPHDAPMDRHILACYSNPTSANAPFFYQPARNEFGGATGDGKANALGGQNDCGIHADNLSARINQRTAGI